MPNPPNYLPTPFAPIMIPPNGSAIPGQPPISAPFGPSPLINFNMFTTAGVPLPPPLIPNAAASTLTQTVPPVPTITSSNNWMEYKAPDGRPYYYNAITKQTSWEKPEELKTEAERLLDACPWKEYHTDDGKTFYHNVVTKNSSWSIPKELEEIKQRIAKEKSQSESTEVKSNQSESPINSNQQQQISEEKLENINAQLFDADSNDNSNSLPEMVSRNSESRASPKDSMPTSTPQQQPSKNDLLEMFKDILREKNISSNGSWENTLKIVGNDPRFERFRSHPERKQFFNAYKIQRAKEEKEEMRNKIRRAKEALASFLRRTDRMNSMIRYRHACEMFRDHEHWKIVPEPDRREIFEDAVSELAKKEREELKQLRKRNMSVLSDILDSMPKITFRTTWQEAQQLLLDNATFAEDSQLLNMDKEDALIVFEEHIRQLESDEEEEKARAKRIQQRQQRLNREAFIQFLDELHASGKLNSLSKWCTLYADISSDARFDAMLSQPLSGSTPLDLFKFYVDDLKARYEDEKIVIKDILRAQHFIMTPDTEFSEFVTILSKDLRSAKLDSGNVKLMHEKLLEKEREKYREKRREEIKQRRRLESHFLSLLSRLSPPLSEHSKWTDVRPLVCNEEAFHLIPSEEERIAIFKGAINSIVESCSHHHNHKSGHHRHRCRTSETMIDNNNKRKDKESKSKKSKYKKSSSSSKHHRHRRSSSSSSLVSNGSIDSTNHSSSPSSESSSLRSILNENERIKRTSNDSSSNNRHSSRHYYQRVSKSRSRSRRLSPYNSKSPTPPSYHNRVYHSRSRSPVLPPGHHSSQSHRPSTSSPSLSRSKQSKYPLEYDIGSTSNRSRNMKRYDDDDEHLVNQLDHHLPSDGLNGDDLEDLEKQRKLLLKQLANST